ncbi:MAG: DUF4935 domain-containing protein [Actinobacteria bacterium]|nr:DUF4935 domain-containing protein [Actinomycetota bacterium]
MDRELSRRKPFTLDGKGKGKGYRDALVWHTVIELVKGSSEPIAFVTKNWRDFSMGKDDRTLHHHLTDDLAVQGLETRVELFENLQEFNEKYVKPHIPKTSNYNPGLVRDYIRQEIMAHPFNLGGPAFTTSSAGFPDFGSVRVFLVDTIVDVEMPEQAQEFASNILVMTAKVDARCGLEFYIILDQMNLVPENVLVGVLRETPHGYATIITIMQAQLELIVAFDPSTQTVKQLDLVGLHKI